MLTLAEIKTYLGILNNTYDTFLTEQEAILSEAIEGYCGRIFTATDYVQTFYKRDFCEDPKKELSLFHFPLITLTEVNENEDGDLIQEITDQVLPYKDTALLRLTQNSEACNFFSYGNEVQVYYRAGFATIPGPVKSVLLSLIEERYNKKVAGVNLNFGSDVQRVSIPGTISIDFDYSLQSNERKTAFGTLLGNHVNVLDFYRSERALIGSGKVEFVEVDP